MSKNVKKWLPMSQALEELLRKMQRQNEKLVDEIDKPKPQEEQVN